MLLLIKINNLCYWLWIFDLDYIFNLSSIRMSCCGSKKDVNTNTKTKTSVVKTDTRHHR